MTLRLKVGTVMSQGDVGRTGRFTVAFRLPGELGIQEESVRYVTPYGNREAAFVAIPLANSQVLCAYEDDIVGTGDEVGGYYYLGSVMGDIPGLNAALPEDSSEIENPSSDYVSKDKPGLFGPDVQKDQTPMPIQTENPTWPDAFKDMYEGKGIIPEAIGLTNYRGDAFKITSRYNSSQKNSPDPFQDWRLGMYSGSGKKIELVDSPIVDGIVMSNEHKGKDFFIWSSGMSKDSPFSEGEYHMRTHGPVNLYTLVNNFHIWVEDGLNIEIENKSTPSKSYGPGINADPTGGGMKAADGGGSNTDEYEEGRQGKYGNESTGCIQLKSKYNNISLQASGSDSVVYVEAPGNEAKVIVDCGGSVDIVSQGKATVQSNTEVEVNAPLVDINGSDTVEVTASEVKITGSDTVEVTAPEVKISGDALIDLTAPKINLTGAISVMGTGGSFNLKTHTHYYDWKHEAGNSNTLQPNEGS